VHFLTPVHTERMYGPYARVVRTGQPNIRPVYTGVKNAPVYTGRKYTAVYTGRIYG